MVPWLRHPAVQGAALAAAFALPLSLALGWFQAQQVVQHTVRLTIERIRPAEQLHQACLAAPESFVLTFSTLGSGHAYDPTGQSRNPDAPAVPPEVLEAFTARPLTFLPRGDDEETYLVRRLAPSGPCALVWVHYQPSDELLSLRHRLSLLVVAGALVSTLLATVLALLPILLRVRRLEAVAQQVGGDEPLQVDPHPDALGRVSEALARSHDRVRAMLAEEVSQRRAVLQHMDDIAHDLNAPLTHALLAVQQARANTDVDSLDHALAELVYIGNLTRNLYIQSYYRVQTASDGAERAPVDVRGIVERTVGRGRAIATSGQTVEGWWPDEPVAVCTHPVVFEQVVSNLVCNAVAHNGTEVTVTALVEAHDGRFRLVVTDDGCGLPAPVDELMQRGVGRGSGLGLAIVHQVCAREGWALAIETGDGGVTAEISGPLAPEGLSDG